MKFQGLLSVRALDKNPFHVSATEADEWVQDFLKLAAPSKDLTGLSAEDWAKAAKISVEVVLEKVGGTDFVMRGNLKGEVISPCSRCGDDFKPKRESEFRVILHRIERGEEVENEADSGDADYIFFRGDEISVTNLLVEQLVILEPVAECPDRKADGSCKLCHKNPQFQAEGDLEKTGQVAENSAVSPFQELLKRRL